MSVSVFYLNCESNAKVGLIKVSINLSHIFRDDLCMLYVIFK